MNRLRVIVLFVVFGSGPAICAAQEGPRASVDLSGGYVGFGDEGLIDHFAIGSGMQWAITRRLSVGPEIVYMIGPHADRDVFVTVKAVFGFIPDAVVTVAIDGVVRAVAPLGPPPKLRLAGRQWRERNARPGVQGQLAFSCLLDPRWLKEGRNDLELFLVEPEPGGDRWRRLRLEALAAPSPTRAAGAGRAGRRGKARRRRGRWQPRG